MRVLWLPVLCIIILFSSCDKENIDNTDKDNKVVSQDVITGLRNGAFDLFRQTVASEDESKNVMISPLSIQYAAGMAASGASGNTLQELLKVFDQTGGIDQINTDLNTLLSRLSSETADHTTQLSNGVFYDPSLFSFNTDYKSVLDGKYDAHIRELSFKEQAKSLDVINGWVADQTKGRIPKVLDDIQQDEFMFLINALYLKASWDKPFDSLATYPTSVYKDSKGNAHTVQMMNQRDDIAYYKSDQERAVILPMAGGKLEAMFIMPAKGGILEYIDGLNPLQIQKIIDGAHIGDLAIGLPKFKVLAKYDLKSILIDMDVKTPFSNAADFEKMGTASARILLTRALHDVFVNVDEKGIEGAAVTTIGVGVTSMPEYVGFERPFVMAVYDKATGVFLFLGKIEVPE